MLKQRQNGLVLLHGLFLNVMITSLFAGMVVILERTGWIQFATGFTWEPYLIGVSAAMLWNHYALSRISGRLGALTFLETCSVARGQLFRLVAVLCAISFASHDRAMSRVFIAAFVVVAGGGLVVINHLLPRLLAKFLFRGLQLRSVVLARAPEARALRSWIADRHHLGHTVAGYLTPAVAGSAHADTDPHWLGSLDQLTDTLNHTGANQIIIDARHFSDTEKSRIFAEAERVGCRVRHFVDLHAAFGADMAEMECDERFAFGASSLGPLDHPINCLLKRALDLAVAIPVVCFVMPPLILVVWVAQRLQSPGPIFYRQARTGLNREPFQIFKFRTMHIDTKKCATHQATKDDDRVFAFGRFLRKSSLDEFPQFINVLIGEMSVSGPRPHMVEHDQRFAEIVEFYYKRHLVKPGITGLAQSEGFRGEIVDPDLLRQRIAHDLRYVRMWSLGLDLQIIANTARQVVRPPSAAY
jgi:exopolysaccharide biosynthesis polyprenyl glycosylphosphotransferase